MKRTISPEIESLIDLIREEISPEQPLYLVGGAVRDLLLGRKLHDLDFVMPEDPSRFAKRLANRLRAGFFILDDQRHTARVVYHRASGDLFPLDFVQFTGEGLKADLKNRDFTINAMAISIHDLATIIDPLDGQADLALSILRACTEHSLIDDPVRVLRGIRLAMQFGFNYADDLLPLMRVSAAHLPKTSEERQRDEFFRILAGSAPANGLEDCRRFGVFETLIPPLVAQEAIPASPPHVLPLFDHTLRVVAYLNSILESMRPGFVETAETPAWLSFCRSALQPFASQINAFFEASITPGRSKRGLALLGALLHDIGKPTVMTRVKDGRLHYEHHARLGAALAREAVHTLRLSNAESEWVETLVRHHMDLLPMTRADRPPTRRLIYQFFKDTGEVGIPIALHSLADTIATYEDTISPKKWDQTVVVTRGLLTAWWDQYEAVVAPTTLLDGDDLQTIFGLKPGEKIGVLLNELEEAQAIGDVSTREEAVSFIRERI